MIPFFDYRPGQAPYAGEIEAAIRRVVDSGQLILGPEVDAFEREFCQWLGADHGVGVASGTDAIILALRALSIGPGDEVITVANAGVPPVAAIRATGAVPRFVDVDASLLLDPTALEAARTERSRAILAVHLYGQPADLVAIRHFADEHGLAVVEDCAQAHGARLGERSVGTFGDVGCFSFYPTKNLGALGDGGFCTTGDATLAERLRELRMYGYRGGPEAQVEGLNSRLDELQAAILRVKLRHLEAALTERRELAGRYLAALAGSSLEPPALRDGVEHAYHLFVVQHDDRQAVASALQAAGIPHAIHYPMAVHRMAAYRELHPACAAALPATLRACERVLSLPLYPGLPASDAQRIVDTLGQIGRVS